MSAAWLRRGDGVVFETLVLETDDGDKGTDSWEKLSDVLSQLLAFLIEKIKAGDCNILICDETGDSLSPAVLACILLVRYQVRKLFCVMFVLFVATYIV